jgi:hypothetical protein
VARRKTLTERARQAFGRARLPHVKTLLRNYQEPDWTDEGVRGAHANAALSLSAADASLRAAFKEAGLDPADPWNWRGLIKLLAEIHFPTIAPRAARGARPKWDEHRRLLFQTHVAMARKQLKQIANEQGYPSPAGDIIADFLRYKWPDYYEHVSSASLRKYIVSGPPKGGKAKR